MKTEDYKKKSVSELRVAEGTLRSEIAKLRLERVAAPPKDTNAVPKKKKALAQVRTFMSQAQAREKLQKQAKV